MIANHNEKRRFRRFYFKPSDWMVAYFEAEAKEISFHANIMNISINGMAFHVATDGDVPLKAGDAISLIKISGGLSISFTGSVNASIKWVVNDPFFKHKSAGCEFMNPPIALTDILGKLIYNEDK